MSLTAAKEYCNLKKKVAIIIGEISKNVTDFNSEAENNKASTQSGKIFLQTALGDDSLDPFQ